MSVNASESLPHPGWRAGPADVLSGRRVSRQPFKFLLTVTFRQQPHAASTVTALSADSALTAYFGL